MKKRCALVCGISWLWFTTTICLFFTIPTEYFKKKSPYGGCQQWNPSFSNPGTLYGNISNVLSNPCIVSFDQHSHTKYGGGGMSPEIAILWHLYHGYNAFAVTDHSYTGNGYREVSRVASEKYGGRVIVVPGIEWTTDRFHINFLFPPATTSPSLLEHITKTLPKGDIANKTFVRELIQRYRKTGAVATFNHPRYTKSFPHGWSMEDAIAVGVDAMEVNDYRGWDKDARKFCAEHHVTTLTGSDVHQVWTYRSIYTIFGLASFSGDRLVDAIRNGKTVTAKVHGVY
jgi:hypothetical protein